MGTPFGSLDSNVVVALNQRASVNQNLFRRGSAFKKQLGGSTCRGNESSINLVSICIDLPQQKTPHMEMKEKMEERLLIFNLLFLANLYLYVLKFFGKATKFNKISILAYVLICPTKNTTYGEEGGGGFAHFQSLKHQKSSQINSNLFCEKT